MEGINFQAYEAELRKKAKKSKDDERAALIGEITDLTNHSRRAAKYEPYTPRTVAVKLSFLSTPQLKDHFYQCYKKDIFDGKKFWGMIKPTHYAKT